MLTRDWSAPRLLMLAAIGLSFLSRFLLYADAETGTTILANIGYAGYGGLESLSYGGGGVPLSGWQMFGPAWVPLLAIAAVFATGAAERGGLARWAWWASAAVLLALSAGAYRFAGPQLGLLAAVLAGAAALLNARRTRAARAP